MPWTWKPRLVRIWVALLIWALACPPTASETATAIQTSACRHVPPWVTGLSPGQNEQIIYVTLHQNSCSRRAREGNSLRQPGPKARVNLPPTSLPNPAWAHPIPQVCSRTRLMSGVEYAPRPFLHHKTLHPYFYGWTVFVQPTPPYSNQKP